MSAELLNGAAGSEAGADALTPDATAKVSNKHTTASCPVVLACRLAMQQGCAV
jgi:hypothetical protein